MNKTQMVTLIEDMYYKGATQAELEQAIKHSVAILDTTKSTKHMRQSYIDNDITSLRKTYQNFTNTIEDEIMNRLQAMEHIFQHPNRQAYDEDNGRLMEYDEELGCITVNGKLCHISRNAMVEEWRIQIPTKNKQEPGQLTFL